MAVLSKGAILAADDVKLKTVDVPEWGGAVYMRVISGADRDKFEQAYSDKELGMFRVRFLAASICDENGSRLFSDEEIDELGRKSSIVINRLFNAAFSHNAFTSEAIDELGKD